MDAPSQGITGALRLQDGSGGALLRVTHYGGLLVTIFNDPDFAGVDRSTTITHIGGTLHVAGIISGFGPQGTNVVDLANAALQVNCVVGCAASTPGPTPHITSVTHVAGRVMLANIAGTAANLTGTSLDVNCTGGCSGGSSDAVNVFHQSTVAHISSVVHMAGVIRGFGIQATDVVDIPNASLKVSQGPARWPVSHITSVTHVYGMVSLVNRAGAYFTMTGSSLDVNMTNSPTVLPGNTANTTAWLVNVQHISSQLHINVASIGGIPIQTSRGLPIQHIATVVHVRAVAYSQLLRQQQVTNCGTSAATFLSAASGLRRDVYLKNGGTVNIYVGGTHATVTTSNGWFLHAGQVSTAELRLESFQGPLACIADGPGQRLYVITVDNPNS